MTNTTQYTTFTQHLPHCEMWRNRAAPWFPALFISQIVKDKENQHISSTSSLYSSGKITDLRLDCKSDEFIGAGREVFTAHSGDPLRLPGLLVGCLVASHRGTKEVRLRRTEFFGEGVVRCA